MIFISDKHITDSEQFSPEFHSILSLIRHGQNWLNWAISAQNMSVFYATSEGDFLSKIQMGLHETPYLHFSAFTLHIDKLMSLASKDLQLIGAELNDDDKSHQKSIKDLEEKYNLTPNEQIESVDTFLNRFELTENPIFLSLNFGERLSLHHFQKTIKNSSVTREALSFASKNAASCSEFIAYSRFYLNCINKQLSKSDTAKVRPQLIQGIFEQLLDISYTLISVPNIGGVNPHQDLSTALHELIQKSSFIGYKLSAQAMEHLALHIEIVREDPLQTKQNIEHYMNLIQENVTEAGFKKLPPPQSGFIQLYQAQKDDFQITLQIDETGNVSIFE